MSVGSLSERRLSPAAYLSTFDLDIPTSFVTGNADILDVRDATNPLTKYVILALYLAVGVVHDRVVSNLVKHMQSYDISSNNNGGVYDLITRSLIKQYNNLHKKTHIKACTNSDRDTILQTCVTQRRKAVTNRILFHYSGHGVPQPSSAGEIWVLDKACERYEKLNLGDLVEKLGSPSVYIFDCGCGGVIINWFLNFIVDENRDDIIFCATSGSESLPAHPDLPEDLFAICMTTPIKIAILWYARRSMVSDINHEELINFIDAMEKQQMDYTSAYGELVWIFECITDTIAWSMTSPKIYHKLFKGDPLVGTLSLNFLLAERILRSYNCNTASYPKLPRMKTWDYILDEFLLQVPFMQDPEYEYQSSTFFEDQLNALDVWLDFGSRTTPPQQLPIILKILQSSKYQERSVKLIRRYLETDTRAVKYIIQISGLTLFMDLLESGGDIHNDLVIIWAKLIAYCSQFREDLISKNYHRYFIDILKQEDTPMGTRIHSAFVLSCLCDNYEDGKHFCLNWDLLKICAKYLTHPDPLFRRWIVLCIAKLWEDFEPAKIAATKKHIHETLCGLLKDSDPRVRAVTVYAIGTFLKTRSTVMEKIEIRLGVTLSSITYDCSPLVRRELIITANYVIHHYAAFFIQIIKDNILKVSNSEDISMEPYKDIWYGLVSPLSNDPFTDNADLMKHLVLIPLYEEAISQLSSEDQAVSPELKDKIFTKLKSSKAQNTESITKPASYVLSKASLVVSNSKKHENEIIQFSPESLSLSKSPGYGSISSVDNEIAIFELPGGNPVKQLVFHTDDKHIIAADNHSNLFVCNWVNSTVNKMWSNSTLNRPVSNLTVMDTNTYYPVLAVATNDSVLRLWTHWCDYEQTEETPKIVSAFNLIPNDPKLRVPNASPYLKVAWKDDFSKIYAGGSYTVLNVIDFNKELCVREISIDTDRTRYISEIISHDNNVVCGFSNGGLSLYDDRSIEDEPYWSLENMSQFVNNIKIQENDMLVSTNDGSIYIWDIRSRKIKSSFKMQTQKVPYVRFHPSLPLIAAASLKQKIMIYTNEGRNLSNITYHDGFLGYRIGHASALTWHSTRPLFLNGCEDGQISVYATDGLVQEHFV